MKRFDKKILQAGTMAIIVLCTCMIFYYILFNSEGLLNAISWFVRVLLPILSGLFIAFILNPLLVFFEHKIVRPICNNYLSKNKKIKNSTIRNSSLLLTYLTFIAALYAVFYMVVPQIISSLQSIISKLPMYTDTFTNFLNNLFLKYPDIGEILKKPWESIQGWFITDAIPKIQKFITNTSTNIVLGAISVLKSFLNVVIGLIISVYVLKSKELFGAQSKKVLYAITSTSRANTIINNARFSYRMFSGFLGGKIIDSIIIGILTFFILVLFKIPYPFFISFIIGLTNVIPFFGPFLGAIPSALLIIVIDPIKCLTFILIIIVVQQLDGNVIGPKILGDTTGLSSFWVIFAITIFGSMMGIFGMFVGVPIFAVIYAAIKTFVNDRLARKHLPVNTSYYIDDDYSADDDDDDELEISNDYKKKKNKYKNFGSEFRVSSIKNKIVGNDSGTGESAKKAENTEEIKDN